MSNFLAVATVSAALQQLLTPAVTAAVGGAEVWVDRSDVTRTKAGVTVYLYRTSIDTARRNEDLPTRRIDGTLSSKPRIATDLHYLLTFHGKDDEMEPQRLMGAVLAVLHSRPFITKQLIADVVHEATDQTPHNAFLATTDLADADEVVRLSPEPLSLDDLSKLWSVFFQTAYRLSATYLASVVMLEEQTGDVVPGPPVQEPQLSVRGLLKPTILRAYSSLGPRAPVVADSVLLIEGSGLLGDQTVVRVGPDELTPAAGDAHASSISVALSAATELRAGLLPVVVAHRWLVGTPPQARAGEVSKAVGVLVCPRITASIVSGDLRVTSDLEVGNRQLAAVALHDPVTGATERVLDVPDRVAGTTQLTADLAGVPGGPYAVSLLVDGAESPVLDASGAVTAPVVTVP